MIQTLIAIIGHHVVPLGGYGVFLTEFVQELLMVIPSTIVSLGFGFFFLHGPLSAALIKTLFLTIVIPATIGLTLGSLVIYGIAYWGGRPLLEKYGKYIGISWHDIEKVNAKLSTTEYDEVFIVLARIFPPIPAVVIAVWGGVTRIPVKKYITLTVIGGFFKALLWAIIGWQLGRLYLYYAVVIERYEHVALLVIVLGCIVYILSRKRGKKVLESGN